MSLTPLIHQNRPLILDKTPLCYGYEYIPEEELYLNFYTNKYGSSYNDLFKMYLYTSTSKKLKWDLGDGSIVYNDYQIIHEYVNSGNKNVKVYAGETTSPEEITSLNAYYEYVYPYSYTGSGITGTFDISKLTKLNNIHIKNNPLTNIIFPNDNEELYLQISDNYNLTKLDISSLTNLKTITIRENYSLSELILPQNDNYNNITNINITHNNISGTLDLRHFKGNLDSIFLYNNKLNNILLADSSYPLTSFFVDNNNIQVLDVSNRVFINSNINILGNKLYNLILPDSSCSFSSFVISNNPSLGMLTNGILDVSNCWFTLVFYISQTCISTLIYDVNKMRNIKYLDISNTLISQPIDLSCFSNLRSLNVKNTNISGLIFPIDGSGMGIDIGNTHFLHGTLDLSSLKSVKTLELNNTDVSVIIWPKETSTLSLDSLNISGCNFSGTLDLSMYKYIGSFNGGYNYNLKNIIFPLLPSPNISYGSFFINWCDITGTLDISALKIGMIFEASKNPHLQSIILPSTYYYGFISFNVRDCSLNTYTIDNILYTLNQYYTNNTPYYDLNLCLDGGGNSPPTDGSLNSDLVSLQTIFNNAGRNLYVYYNI